jgi:hypothetical protein
MGDEEVDEWLGPSQRAVDRGAVAAAQQRQDRSVLDAQVDLGDASGTRFPVDDRDSRVACLG